MFGYFRYYFKLCKEQLNPKIINVMKKKSLRIIPLTVLLLVLFFIMEGCKGSKTEGGDDNPSQVENPKPNVSDYFVSTCLADDRRDYYDDNDTIYVAAIDDNSLKIRTTNTLFNCCSEEFWEEVSVEGNNITVSMYEYYELPCDCECPRSVEFVLKDLEIGQTYKIVLDKQGGYGYFSFELVFAEDVDMMFVRE